MDVGDFSHFWVEAERKPKVGWFWWGSDAARPRPEESFALCRFAALGHVSEKACLLVRWDLVLLDVTLPAGAVVKAIALDVPPRAHVDFSVPGWSFLG